MLHPDAPPITKNETNTPIDIKIIGHSVEYIPTARPEMIVVAAPVSDCVAIFCTDEYSSEVYISVILPIIIPTINPEATAKKALKISKYHVA